MESESECPYLKLPANTAYRDREKTPNYFRYFHKDNSGDQHLCCKLAPTSIFDVKGWKYKRHSVVGRSILLPRSGDDALLHL